MDREADRRNRRNAAYHQSPYAPPAERQRGKVVHFDTGRGYFFIAPEGGGEDVYGHIERCDSETVGQLRKGCTVEYTLRPVPGKKGLSGDTITVVVP